MSTVENPNVIGAPSSTLRRVAIETFPFDKLAFGRIELAILDKNGNEVRPEVAYKLQWDEVRGRFEGHNKNYSDEQKVRPNRIEITSLDGNGLKEFKTSVLPTLTKLGYKITEADLALTTYHLRDNGGGGIMGGDYMKTGLTISPYSIQIVGGSDLPNEQRQQLKDLLDGLQQNSQA